MSRPPFLADLLVTTPGARALRVAVLVTGVGLVALTAVACPLTPYFAIPLLLAAAACLLWQVAQPDSGASVLLYLLVTGWWIVLHRGLGADVVGAAALLGTHHCLSAWSALGPRWTERTPALWRGLARWGAGLAVATTAAVALVLGVVAMPLPTSPAWGAAGALALVATVVVLVVVPGDADVEGAHALRHATVAEEVHNYSRRDPARSVDNEMAEREEHA